MTLRLGIDLGGTKIAAIVLDVGNAVRWERRVATPRGEYIGTLEAIAGLVESAEHELGVTCSVGLGIPGAVSPATGRVKNANSTWLNGQPLREDLERRLSRPLRFENDANCLAMSEAHDDAAAGTNVVFAVILGTGTGGGVVVGGEVVTGANAIGGEWGHNSLPWPDADERPGPACYCGRTGCIETFLSGPGLSADYVRRGGSARSGAEIVALAGTGDLLAAAVLDVWRRRLAKSLASIINVLDPDVIVVGGGLSGISSLYDSVPRLWGDWVFSDAVVTRLAPARHGDASGARGAAWLWPVE